MLVGASASFTAVLILLVFALSQPYDAGGGSANPRLIEETTAYMVSQAPQLAGPCTPRLLTDHVLPGRRG